MGPGAFFDLPWLPFYLAICFAFHWLLGVTALAGAILARAVTGGEADTAELESLVKELAAGTLTAAAGLAPGLDAGPGADGGLVIDGSCGPVLGAGLADLLILRDEMPRSLASCYENLVVYLDHIARAYGRQGLAQRHARAVRTQLENSRMDEIFQQGMHEFISEFIDNNNRLGAAIAEQYLM